ncbi:MAG: hypothetical protein ACM3O3_06545 [Syntrophothermus sp.]
MARIKNAEAFCNVCGAVRKMEIAGDVSADQPNKKWAKCKKCKQTMIIELSDEPKEKKPSLEGIENENYTVYSPASTYSVGESIFHQSWDDYGRVVSKEILGNGKSSIVVEFKKSGKKKLIESIK